MNKKVKEIKELMSEIVFDFGDFTEEDFENYFKDNLVELKIIDILEQGIEDLN